MQVQRSDLLLFWLGGGFVLLLAWAAVMGQALTGERRTKVPAAIGLLAGMGLFHPAAAAAALDLIRLCRTLDEPELRLPGWALPATAIAAVVGIAVTLVLWFGAA